MLIVLFSNSKIKKWDFSAIVLVKQIDDSHADDTSLTVTLKK